MSLSHAEDACEPIGSHVVRELAHAPAVFKIGSQRQLSGSLRRFRTPYRAIPYRVEQSQYILHVPTPRAILRYTPQKGPITPLLPCTRGGCNHKSS